jgi:hypothetical protein
VVLKTKHNGPKLLNLTEGHPKDRSVWYMPQRPHISEVIITIDNNICNCFGEVYSYKLESTTVRAAVGNVQIPQDNFSSENKPSNPTAEQILFKVLPERRISLLQTVNILTTTSVADGLNSLRKVVACDPRSTAVPF